MDKILNKHNEPINLIVQRLPNWYLICKIFIQIGILITVSAYGAAIGEFAFQILRIVSK